MRVCSCGSVYNGETKKKIINRSIEHQQESIKCNWSSSGTTGMPGNAQRNARANLNGYAPKLSPWKIDILIGKWGNHWKLISISGMDKIKCWAETMRTLLRQMRGNLCSKKWKHYIEIWRHFVLRTVQRCSLINSIKAWTSVAEISRFQ